MHSTQLLTKGSRLRTGFSRFSTDDLPKDLRVPQWERHNAHALLALKARTEGGPPLRATELNLSLPHVSLARVTGTAHRVIRDETHVAAYPARGVIAYVALHGTGRFEHRGGTSMISPGRGILVDGDQPFERVFSHGLTELAIKIPRHLLSHGVRGPLSRSPHEFDAGDAGGAGGRIARLAAGALSGRPVAWEPLEKELTRLVAELLTHTPAAGYLAVAEAFIRSHYGRRGLSAADIASAVGISERHLTRVLSASGSTVPHAILTVRLEGARRILATESKAHLPMSEVAARCGFVSQAEFSRRYRERFGSSPLRHRRMLLTELSEDRFCGFQT